MRTAPPDRKRRGTLFLLPLLLLAALSPTPASALGPQSLLDRVVARSSGYGGGVARAAQGPAGRVLWEGASGEAVRGGPAMPADANFEIASTSKAFTAALVLRLAEEGTLDLDAPISTYLPPSYTQGLLVIDGHDYGPELTLRQLLSHTAGLPDYWNDPPWIIPGVNAFLFDYIRDPDRFWTPEEILAYVPDLDPIFVPGTGWHYSDTGFLLAGMIAERVTGLSLQDLYAAYIYQPLGLHDTWLHWREPSPGTRTESHRYEGTYDMYLHRHNSADWAGGGLVSTTGDLERFLRGIADDALFANPATKDAMMAWVPTGTPDIEYGLGLFHVNLGAGMGWIWGHDGYGNSFAYYWPRHDVTFTGGLNQTENDWWPLVFLGAWAIDRP